MARFTPIEETSRFTPIEEEDADTSKIEPEGIGARVSREIADIPRQLGLTARHGIEGIGDIADLVSSPVRAGLNAAGMNIQGRSGKTLADIIGLPEPQGATERVVGDVSRLMAGSGGVIGAAGKMAQGATGATQAILKAMANRPDLQAASAVGAGGAGGVVREAGGDPLAQAIAALVGGVSAPVAVSGAQKTYNALAGLMDRAAGSPQLNARIDVLIDNALPQGVRIGDLNKSVVQSLRSDMQKAMKVGEISPDVVRRLVDYHMLGLKPTAGPLTLDPGIVTRQKNLAALGASSQDPKLQALSQIENANTRKLIENINRLGADTADDALTAGQKVIGALSAKEQAAKTKIGGLYEQARDTSGRSALLDGKAFVRQVNDSLKQQFGKRWGEFVPKWLTDDLDEIAKGGALTVDDANIMKTLIGNETKSAAGNTRYALGAIRRVLDDVPTLAGRGDKAMQAANAARAANRQWMKTVEQTPALQAIRDGVEPDKFVQSFITGKGNAASVNSVAKLRDLIKDMPEAMTAVKNNIAQSLKGAALGGKADELARFSSSAYNRSLNNIGDAKLSMFFSPDEIQALKAIGRVASYEQFLPSGSAVNTSKTAAALVANVLDRLGGNPIVNKLTLGTSAPVARIVSGPLREASASAEAGRLAGVPVSIGQKPATDPLFLFPPVLAPYLIENQ